MYRESADDVVGYIEWVDLFVSELDTWAARVRPLPNLPESISASLALARMREADAELALVLDEYGETAGILTVRDVLDEIAERETSFDRSTVPGSTPLHLLNGLAGLELEDGPSATNGGCVTDREDRIWTRVRITRQAADSPPCRVVDIAGRVSATAGE